MEIVVSHVAVYVGVYFYEVVVARVGGESFVFHESEMLGVVFVFYGYVEQAAKIGVGEGTAYKQTGAALKCV